MPAADWAALVLSPGALGVLGLVIGSFLNVVVHRLPAIYMRGWWAFDIADFALGDRRSWAAAFGRGAEPPSELAPAAAAVKLRLEALAPLSLWRPRSHCPQCGHQLRAVENVPLVSWLLLGRRCSACKAPISWRYPLLEAATAALARFKGVKRRQELRGEERGVAVIDDFAHHPTAVRGSIGALRQRFAGRRLIAVFEPRTNTSRRAIFQQEYAQALREADRVFIRSVPEIPLYSATGPVEALFSAEQLVADLLDLGTPAQVCDSVAEIVERLTAECRSGDVVLCMSNGSFDNIWQRLLDALRGSSEAPQRQSRHE